MRRCFVYSSRIHVERCSLGKLQHKEALHGGCGDGAKSQWCCELCDWFGPCCGNQSSTVPTVSLGVENRRQRREKKEGTLIPDRAACRRRGEIACGSSSPKLSLHPNRRHGPQQKVTFGGGTKLKLLRALKCFSEPTLHREVFIRTPIAFFLAYSSFRADIWRPEQHSIVTRHVQIV